MKVSSKILNIREKQKEELFIKDYKIYHCVSYTAIRFIDKSIFSLRNEFIEI